MDVVIGRARGRLYQSVFAVVNLIDGCLPGITYLPVSPLEAGRGDDSEI